MRLHRPRIRLRGNRAWTAFIGLQCLIGGSAWVYGLVTKPRALILALAGAVWLVKWSVIGHFTGANED